jgi:hypothetical protein
VIVRPIQIARFGVYAAAGLAAGSMLLPQNSGTPLDAALLRAFMVFVASTAMALGAEAVHHSAPVPASSEWLRPTPPGSTKAEAPEASSESVEDESE